MKIALCTIARYEDNYLDEWIEYHHKLGFTDICIYENGYDWKYSGKYANVSFVHRCQYDRNIPQEEALSFFFKDHKEQFDWVAFFDVDEFLVLKNGCNNIEEFLNEYYNYNGICFNWRYFGDNDKKFNGTYSVIERFTRCTNKLNSIVKIIVNLNKTGYDIKMNCAHCLENNEGIVNVSKHGFMNGMMHNDLNLDECINIAYLNHYYTKTYEEFKLKVDKAFGYFFFTDEKYKRKLNQFNEFHSGKYNEVEDLSALNFIKSGHFNE